MKRILWLVVVLALGAVVPIHAQDTALLEERIKQLMGKVENLEEANASLRKQIDSLSRDLSSVREHQQNQPTTTPASQDDLRELAKKVREIDENRKSDAALIARQIEELGRTMSKGIKSRKETTATPPTTNNSDLPEKVIEHTIGAGDTLSTIAVAYNKEKGLKLTVDAILKANPGLKAEKLKVGQKILIPVR